MVDSNNTIIIEDGDLKVGFSDAQHIDHVVKTAPGEIKDFPLFGVGIFQDINSPTSPLTKQKIKKSIRLQLAADGAGQIKVSYTGNELNVSAVYGD